MTLSREAWEHAADILDPRPNPYLHNAVGWVHDMIDWTQTREGGPTFYQDEIPERLPIERKVTVRGPHGLGKTAIAAQIVLWFASTRDGLDWKALTTASAWRQLTIYLWPEIHKWSRLLRWDKLGRPPFSKTSELLKLQLTLGTGAATAVASDEPSSIEGAHADHLLYVLDEAKVIPAGTFEALEGAFSGAGGDIPREALALMISTPGTPDGYFYDVHRRKAGTESWWVRHVTLDEAIAAGRVTRPWADEKKLLWGEQSSAYQNRVLGEFATQSEDAVIPLAWIEAAVQRWHEFMECEQPLPPFTCVGVDVARFGSDKTTFARRHCHVVKEVEETALEDTTQTSARVRVILRANPSGYAYIDVIGVGGGVVDTLASEQLNVYGFNAAARSMFLDESGELGFANKRAEGWWNMRMLLDPARGSSLCLPPDDKLIGDLAAPRWRVSSQGGGVIQVESKDEIVKRLGRSTDHADAVIHAYAPLPADDRPSVLVYDEPVQISPF